MAYDGDASFAVAEGLSIITGLVVSSGDAVYLSLCGAGQDGKVVASVSTSRREPAMVGAVARRERRMGGVGQQRVVSGCYRFSVNDFRWSLVRLVLGYALTLVVDPDTKL